jgi:hypothetical protein
MPPPASQCGSCFLLVYRECFLVYREDCVTSIQPRGGGGVGVLLQFFALGTYPRPLVASRPRQDQGLGRLMDPHCRGHQKVVPSPLFAGRNVSPSLFQEVPSWMKEAIRAINKKTQSILESILVQLPSSDSDLFPHLLCAQHCAFQVTGWPPFTEHCASHFPSSLILGLSHTPVS